MVKVDEKVKVEIVTASTDVEAGTTGTVRIPIQPFVAQPASTERNRNATAFIVGHDQSLEKVRDQLVDLIGTLLDGEQPSTHFKYGGKINLITINNPTAPIYIQSEGKFTNINEITPTEVFTELRKIIETQIKQEEKRSGLLSKITELEEAQGTKKFVEKYTEFVTLAANHIALFTPFWPILAEWVSRLG